MEHSESLWSDMILTNEQRNLIRLAINAERRKIIVESMKKREKIATGRDVMNRSCVGCGTEFFTHALRKMYCSYSCSETARKERKRQRTKERTEERKNNITSRNETK